MEKKHFHALPWSEDLYRSHLWNKNGFYKFHRLFCSPSLPNKGIVTCFQLYHLCSEKFAFAKTYYLGYRKTKILEPVSSISRRGARAAYHDEVPEIWARGWLIL